jgi:hypothetical protein
MGDHFASLQRLKSTIEERQAKIEWTKNQIEIERQKYQEIQAKKIAPEKLTTIKLQAIEKEAAVGSNCNFFNGIFKIVFRES